MRILRAAFRSRALLRAFLAWGATHPETSEAVSGARVSNVPGNNPGGRAGGASGVSEAVTEALKVDEVG